jgi:hypothetical protein
LGSPILPCPYVETRDIHTVLGSPILPCPYAEIRVMDDFCLYLYFHRLCL